MGPGDSLLLMQDPDLVVAPHCMVLTRDSIPAELCRKVVLDKFACYPRFRQRVIRRDWLWSMWENVPDFNIDEHFFAHEELTTDQDMKSITGDAKPLVFFFLLALPFRQTNLKLLLLASMMKTPFDISKVWTRAQTLLFLLHDKVHFSTLSLDSLFGSSTSIITTDAPTR